MVVNNASEEANETSNAVPGELVITFQPPSVKSGSRDWSSGERRPPLLPLQPPPIEPPLCSATIVQVGASAEDVFVVDICKISRKHSDLRSTVAMEACSKHDPALVFDKWWWVQASHVDSRLFFSKEMTQGSNTRELTRRRMRLHRKLCSFCVNHVLIRGPSGGRACKIRFELLHAGEQCHGRRTGGLCLPNKLILKYKLTA